MAKCLLIGNGINLLSGNGQSWHQVLSDLASEIEKQEIMELSEHKPFTLIYEEISIRSFKFKDKKEIELKNHVGQLAKKIKPNDFHERFINSNVDHILTTNYDYSFELSCKEQSAFKANLKRETKYSNFRRRNVKGKSIWHIHGEADVPNSITLGYEQYSGTIQKMRSYLTDDSKNNAGIVSPFKLGDYDFENNSEVYSWLDVFLRDDVHIIGLGLDYNEIDLWWLLAYKARLKQSKSLKLGQTHYHHFYDKELNDKEKAKHQILESLEVQVHAQQIDGDYKDAYSLFINQQL